MSYYGVQAELTLCLTLLSGLVTSNWGITQERSSRSATIISQTIPLVIFIIGKSTQIGTLVKLLDPIEIFKPAWNAWIKIFKPKSLICCLSFMSGLSFAGHEPPVPQLICLVYSPHSLIWVILYSNFRAAGFTTLRTKHFPSVQFSWSDQVISVTYYKSVSGCWCISVADPSAWSNTAGIFELTQMMETHPVHCSFVFFFPSWKSCQVKSLHSLWKNYNHLSNKCLTNKYNKGLKSH